MNVKHSKGISLIELLLAMSLSAMVSLAVYQLFFLAQRQFGYYVALCHLQERRQIVSQLFSAMVRQAGYSGCLAWQSRYKEAFINILSANAELPGKPSMMILDSHSDIVYLARYSLETGKLLERVGRAHHIAVSAQPHFKKNDLLVIHDCEKQQHFIVDAVKQDSNSQILSVNKTLKSFSKAATVNSLQTFYWVVADTQRKNQTGRPIYALYLYSSINGWQEVIQGVYQLKAKFQQTAKGKMFRLTLLLASDEEILQQPQDNMPSLAFQDRRFYQFLHLHIPLLNWQ